jgi:hypothetical protein
MPQPNYFVFRFRRASLEQGSNKRAPSDVAAPMGSQTLGSGEEIVMDNINQEVVPFIRRSMSPPPYSLADQMDHILRVLNVAENLPVLSEGIRLAAAEGEPYEVLVRKIETLHMNLAHIATSVTEAKSVVLRDR